jgi:hypothetical protein
MYVIFNYMFKLYKLFLNNLKIEIYLFKDQIQASWKKTSLSTKFQLYRGGQFYFWRTTMNPGNIFKNIWFTKII